MTSVVDLFYAPRRGVAGAPAREPNVELLIRTMTSRTWAPEAWPLVKHELVRALGTQKFVDWSFRHYLEIAPPPAGAR